MSNFQYDESLRQGTPEKKNQAALQKVAGYVERKLSQKILDFLDML